MDTPELHAPRFLRSALRAIILYISVIMFASTTMVNPVHASGTVTSTLNKYFVWGSGFGNYVDAASPAEACGPSGSQTTGPVVTQVSPSRWQCTYTYRSDVGLPPSYWGTH